MKNNSLNSLKVLLITLITSLAITGMGLLDEQLWNIIFALIGALAFFIVGGLYSLNIISGKDAGKTAYIAIVIVLAIIAFFLYQGIVKFEQWLISWPLWVKILVPSLFFIGIVIIIIILIVESHKNKVKDESNKVGETAL